jgi:UDP-GlcNAc:undecaprenyl-phosphate GlcNAc-1-phosphate transferase
MCRTIGASGGLAIYLAMVATFAVLIAAGQWRPGPGVAALPIVALGGLMLLVGLWDDFRGLTPAAKLAAQGALAVLAWSLGFRILDTWSYDGTGFQFGILSLPMTVLWIVAITNAFNLIDGLDGLAAGTALFATMSLLFASMVTGQPDAVLLLAVLGGATAGFLRYNFNPASIFLGDSGSFVLGFTLAVLSIEASQKSAAAFAIAMPVFALGLPIIDTAFVIVRRVLSRRPIMAGDRRHLHHALIERGFSPRSAVLLLYAVAGGLGLLSLLFLNPIGKPVGLAFAMLGVCVLIGIQQLHIPELGALQAAMWQQLRHQREMVAATVAMREAGDRLRSATSASETFDALRVLLERSTFTRATVRLHDPDASGALAPVVRTWRTGGGTWEWIRGDSTGLGPEWRMVFPLSEGTLTLHHRQQTDYPVSAVCWIGEGLTTHVDQALQRVQARRWRGHRPAWSLSAGSPAAVRLPQGRGREPSTTPSPAA